MTILTKSLGEKKSDNLQEPLVENIVVEPSDDKKNADIEAGGYPIPPPQTTRYIISANVRPYYSLMFILMLVLLVATSLLGIFGTEYLYEQYKYLVGAEQQPEIYHAFGTLSYDDPTALEYENKVPARFERTQDPMENSLLSLLFRQSNNVVNEANSLEKMREQFKNELQEEFELDVEKNRYEKINVPNKSTNRFVHDFYSNFSAIVDIDNKRCFITPLDRSVVVPPKSLYDLIMKMSDGYYNMDTEKIRSDLKVTDRITDVEPLGVYIKQECENYDIYKLEKVVENGVVKRSIENDELFTYFDGKRIVEINIRGIGEHAPQAIP